MLFIRCVRKKTPAPKLSGINCGLLYLCLTEKMPQKFRNFGKSLAHSHSDYTESLAINSQQFRSVDLRHKHGPQFLNQLV